MKDSYLHFGKDAAAKQTALPAQKTTKPGAAALLKQKQQQHRFLLKKKPPKLVLQHC
ncbi:UNVERIFIED_CONTAM: hypothetical protein Sradi_3848200 [Sesamum radiatum]|uniref:Uncharacterized protein n=1 Tax=Sesamum radiatum TaxID=300843 RepID=A0AAW2Q1R5_SESRA